MNRKRLGGGDGDGVAMVLTFMVSLTLENEKTRKDTFGFVSRAKVFVAFGKSYHIRT